MSNETLSAEDGQVLWMPGPDQLNSSRLVQYQRWLSAERGIETDDYNALWQWSVDNLNQFWLSIWDFFTHKSVNMSTLWDLSGSRRGHRLHENRWPTT